jgi:hypothetical protein
MTGQPQFSEEELRQIEAEMERITADDVLLQTIVTLLNLAARKAGLAAPPGQEPKRDLEQVRLSIEGVRALLPLVEPRHGDKLGQVKQMLSQLQMAYAQLTQQGGGGGAPPAGPEGPEPAAPPEGPQGGEAAPPQPEEPKGPGPAQQSGRLWVPGQ